MKAGAITFLLFLASLGLARWNPRESAAAALRLRVGALLGFFSGIALLAALFTVSLNSRPMR